jgi:hypothetical protein
MFFTELLPKLFKKLNFAVAFFLSLFSSNELKFPINSGNFDVS